MASQTQQISPAADLALYVCPTCKGQLALTITVLRCPACNRIYDLRGEIPNFILQDLTKSTNPIFRKLKGIDRLARIYESKFWYPIILSLAAGRGRMSLPQLITMVQEMVGPVTGLVLDVACGPGTYGRRVASSLRKVYAIDISQGMLEQGVAYAYQEHVANISFARAQVEALPFGNEVFDGAICSGSLHLFLDTGAALREINRTMKPGASLAILTFTAGDAGILRFPTVLNRVRKKGLRVFAIPELQQILSGAGFENYRPTTYGSLLAATAQKSHA